MKRDNFNFDLPLEDVAAMMAAPAQASRPAARRMPRRVKRDVLTPQLDLGHELIIDNFAGGGGTSTGLEEAFGRPVDTSTCCGTGRTIATCCACPTSVRRRRMLGRYS